MILRISSVIGDALNFGARRMETIMRVAWLPVSLMLIANMVMVFLLLSVAYGRVITMPDVPSFEYATALASKAITMGIMGGSKPVMIILAGALLINTILVASFMAPIIRLAGLGEKPRRGLLNAPFGMDQIRYVMSGIISFLTVVLVALGPIAVATYYVAKQIYTALAKTYAKFPNESSLHTIELVSGADVIAGRGEAWMYNLGWPAIAAAPFAILFWLLLIQHFKPSNRAGTGDTSNVLVRSLIILMSLGVLTIAAPAALLLATGAKVTSEALLFSGIYVLALLIILYVNLRMTPYQAIAVNERSFSPNGLLKVTRGWNIVRLLLILFFLAVILAVMEFLIVELATPLVLSTGASVLTTLGSYTKLISGGDDPSWVVPAWTWFSTLIKITVTLFWTFFSYGATAGLYGRLFRDSRSLN